MTKQELISSLKDELEGLKVSHLYKFRIENNYIPVLGQGSLDAKIMIVGEAPGVNEAKSGKPFCGKSGMILDEVLASVKLNREKIYITNIVNDRPPENRDPSPKEIELYSRFLDKQIEIIQPKIIITLGRISMGYILKKYSGLENLEPISKIHGREYLGKLDNGFEFKIIPMFHPAATIYNKEYRRDLYDDFKNIKKV